MQAMAENSRYLGEFEQLLLLAILQCGDDAYTVPIRDVLLEKSGRHVARGALFTSLDRLEAKGIVKSRMSAPIEARGGRARRYYSVTPAGLDALRAARAAMATMAQGLESLLERR